MAVDKMTADEMLDWLEEVCVKDGGLVLHTGGYAGNARYSGLGFKMPNISRDLRAAIAQAARRA